MKIYLVRADYGSSYLKAPETYIVSAESREDAENKFKKVCVGAIYTDIKEISIDTPYYIDEYH